MKTPGLHTHVSANDGNVERLRRHQKGIETREQLEKVAEDFESLLVNELYKSMRRTVQRGDGETSMGQDIFTGMLDEELAKISAKNGSMGFKKMLVEQFGAHLQPEPFRPSDAQLGLLRDSTRWITPLGDMPKGLSKGQLFGAERPGLRPEECGDGHCGIDLARPTGTPVRTVGDGIVSDIIRNSDGPGGLTVVLEHAGGIQSRYLHLSEISSDLVVGQHVQKGQELGAVGNTGSASRGEHLHFEMRLRDSAGKLRAVDPGAYVGRWQTLAGTGNGQKDGTLAQAPGALVDEGGVHPPQSDESEHHADVVMENMKPFANRRTVKR